MKYDGILFDLDGTLWDATEAIAVSWAQALRDAPDVEAPALHVNLYQIGRDLPSVNSVNHILQIIVP